MQTRFGEYTERLCSGLIPRPDLETIPFVGTVGGVTPSLQYCMPETRRKDVGPQSYGAAAPKANGSRLDRHGLYDPKGVQYTSVPTEQGEILLSASDERGGGFMPTGTVVDFLRSQYVGSRHSPPPARYFP